MSEAAGMSEVSAPDRTSRPRLTRRRALILLVVFAAILVLTHGSWMPAMGRWLDVGEPPRPSDYCLVLSGDYEQRPFGASALYTRGYIRQKIWLTLVAAGPRDLREEPTIEAAVRHLLVVMGVPGDRVAVLDGTCASTFDEARALAHALELQPDATVIVVTSNYHTRRARWVFRHVLGDRAARIRFFSVPTDYFDASCWWKSSEGFSLYTSEYLKLGFYLLWYGSAGWWLGGAIFMVAAVWWWRRRRRSEAALSRNASTSRREAAD
jgi:uncharacterized SAM-binding protein YcdF (DUF218 family)